MLAWFCAGWYKGPDQHGSGTTERTLTNNETYTMKPGTLLLIIMACPVFADIVVPSDREVHGLNVREALGGGVVGALQVGESAQLIESVRFWHKVELNSGTIGFISKGYSKVLVTPVVNKQWWWLSTIPEPEPVLWPNIRAATSQ
ncbi:MAG: SH3 domain-containing protein [Gammaproteobacteria bacterium]|nr:SH3 domain-containing protein [Gammaproteobacteria bacterium]